MEIALISPYSDITSLGIRILSACLKKAGQKTKLIFLPASDTTRLKVKSDFIEGYEETVLDDVVDLCSSSDLVGVSLMTNYFLDAVQLTKKLKEELHVPIIWGGIHPTVQPEGCLSYADMVCIGEGEECIVELAQKMEIGKDYYDTSNIWFNNSPTLKCGGNGIIRNNVRPLIQDLDSLPFPDYELDEHFVLDARKHRVIRMTEDLLLRFLPAPLDINNIPRISYKTMATRGCPHNCTYCCNNALRMIYHGQRYVRRRSIENIIEEILQIRKKVKDIRIITFADDSFFAASANEIKQFSEVYKEKIGLPFRCLGSPLTITEEKMDYLVDAGLLEIQMGIQTGSERTKKLYNRRISNERVERAARIINKYKSQTRPPKYDVIIDNPYESDEDLLETLGLLLKIPKPYKLTVFSLVFFPGTEIAKRAEEDKLIKDPVREIYSKNFLISRLTYLHVMFNLIGHRFPKWLLRPLLNKWIVRLLNRESLTGLYTFIYRSVLKMSLYTKLCIRKLRRNIALK